jgi:hypothetical protein
LNQRFERNPNKEGKEFVKFIDGLANVATKHDGFQIRPAALRERYHMISIAGGRTIDFVLEAFTFELQGLMCSLQLGE